MTQCLVKSKGFFSCVFLLALGNLAGVAGPGPRSLPAAAFEDGLTPDWVITSEEIERSGAAVLGEVLGRFAGLEVIDRGYLGARKLLSLTGIPPDRLLVLIDGEVVDDPGSRTFDINLIPISAVERIEVFRHPIFLDRDTRAAGGVVKVTTKRHEGGEPFTRLTLTGGSLQTNILRGSFRRGLLQDRLGLSLSVNRMTTGGLDTEGDHSSLQYHIRADERFLDKVELSLWGTGTASSVEAAAGEESVREVGTGFHAVNVSATLRPNERTRFDVLTTFTRHARDSLDQETSAFVEEREEDRIAMRLKGTGQATGWLAVSVGLEGEHLRVDERSERSQLAIVPGAFLDLDSFPRTEFMMRWEQERSLSSNWSGGVSTSQAIGRTSSLFLSFWQVRHHPPLSGGVPPGREWESERLIESGLRYGFGRLRGSLSGFFRRTRGESTPTDVDVFVPSDPLFEYREIGWRSTAAVEAWKTVSMRLGYQLVDVRDASPGEVEVPIPLHYVTGALEARRSFKHDNLGLGAAISGTYVSGRGQAIPASLAGDDHYGALDLNLSLRIVDVTFFLTVRNLLDGRYAIVGGYPMPGRVGRFGFTWDFYD